MTTMPANYFDRTDPSKEYEQHLFIAGRGLQSAELNEIQIASASRMRGIADAIFKDGGIVRDAVVVVNPETGVAQCGSGALYIRGAVRGVAPATFTIPTTGSVAIGVRLVETVVTALQDPALRDPATGTRNYDERGAERLKVHSQWGWDGDAVSGQFYPVYGVVDGVLTTKEPPPNLDAVTQALARYDRDSAGGSYVVSGMAVSKLLDDGSGNQVYTIADGRARVYGYPIEFTTAKRVVYAAVPELLSINDEPHLSSTAGPQRINLDRTPATNITQVAVTLEKTVTLTHGIVTGSQDPLPDTSVLQIVEVKQGGTTYTINTDYKLTAGKVDWSPSGAEPAPGSTYTCKYQYIANVTPTGVDDNGFSVTGAVPGTIITVDYQQKLPRIDRLCLNSDGFPVWVKGVSSAFNPQLPNVPGDLLPLASVYQQWTANRSVVNDGVRTVPMPFLAGLSSKIDYVLGLVAQQRLESNIHTREGGTKKGLFVDPFIDDSQRDAGTVQTAAISNGELTLPIAATVMPMTADIPYPLTLTYTSATRISFDQYSKTSSMKINPYMAFAPAPAIVKLTPSVDRWTEVLAVWTSPVTNRFNIGAGDQSSTSSVTRNILLNSTTVPDEKLRQIPVTFEASGFGPGEVLSSVTFDGIPVAVTAP